MTIFKPGRRACGAALLLGTSLLISGTSGAQSPAGSGAVERNPAQWRTWVLASGSAYRLPPPPDAAGTRAELDQVRTIAASRDAAALERIAWWHAAAPSYRWNQIALEEVLRAGIPVNLASRHLAVLHTALADAMVAAWDSKQAHGRPPPGALDPSLRPAIASPAYPSYPDEHAVAGATAAAVLSRVFPQRAAEFARLAEEAGQMRVVAGVAFPSDVSAGATLGLRVAEAALERARRDGSDGRWTGAVPTAPGQWTGASPALPQASNWMPWLLSSAAEFRPPPPPAAGSPERADEMAQLRAVQRTPLTNARALFWETAAGGLRSHEYWNAQAGRLLLEYGRGGDAAQAARIYALLNVAMYDSGVACWDAKYAYWTARPVQIDREFPTVFPAPSHPSYPSAHGCFSTTAAAVLAHVFSRDAAGLLALAREAGESRIWAGIHYRSDVVAAERLGQRVAERVIEYARRDSEQYAP